MKQRTRSIAGALVLAFAGVACTTPQNTSTNVPPPPSPTKSAAHRRSSGPTESPIPPESPVPDESNPPGDIPDNTQFIPYRSKDGNFLVKVPEGWARSTTHAAVSFTDKLNTVVAAWFPATVAPTLSTAKTNDVKQLRRTVRAFQLTHIVVCSPSCTIPYSTAPISVTLPAGPALVITYDSNSAPNPVTGKQYRDENLRFEFFKNGEETALTLSGPVGSDNVDPWRLVSESFRWR